MRGMKYFLLLLCLASAADLVLCHLTIRAEQLSVWDNGGQYDVNVANMFPGHILLNAVLKVESQVQIAQIWGAQQVGTCPPPPPKDGTRDSRGREASCVLVSPPPAHQCLGVKAQTGDSWSFAFALVSSRGYANFTAAITARVVAVERNFTRSPTVSTTPFPLQKVSVRQRPGRMQLEEGSMVVVQWSMEVRSLEERRWIERLSFSIPCEGQGGATSIRDLWGARVEKSEDSCRLVFPDDMRIPPGGIFELVGYKSIVYFPEPLTLNSAKSSLDAATA